MKAVVLRRPRLLELADVPKPRLTEPHHVLIRVEACGICGSDLRYWTGENPWALHTLGRHVPNPPNIILGHEFAGVVAEVNSAGYDHWLGKRVGVQAYRKCGVCAFCRSGRENLCKATIHTGHAQGWGPQEYYPGAYAEYCVGWGDLLYEIPVGTSFEEAAMADIFCVAVHVVGRASRSGGNVLCVGGGPVGLSIAQVLRAGGAERVFVSESSPAARDVLARFPYIVAIDPQREEIGSVLARHSGSPVASAVYDTVGAPETIAQALDLLAESGTLVNVAVHDSPLSVNLMALGSERTVTSSSNAFYRDVAEAYDLICTRRVDAGAMITHRFSLDDFATAFDLLLGSPKRAYKVVLHP